MAELIKPPPITQVEVTVVHPKGGNEKRQGVDYNSVLRGVLVALRDREDCSTRELSGRMGMRQQTLSALLSDRSMSGTSLRIVSELCAALNMTIDELFALHPTFDAARREGDRLTDNISIENQERIRSVLQRADASGVLDLLLDQMESSLAVIERSDNRKTRPARRKKSS